MEISNTTSAKICINGKYLVNLRKNQIYNIIEIMRIKMYHYVAVVAAAMMSLYTQAQNSEIKSRVLEDGGTGAYKAIMATDSTLKTHTIFRPQDLSAFGKKNPLPILVWGNGGCANSPWEHINFLNEIASNGFLVVAIGPMPAEGQRGGGNSKSSQLKDAMDWVAAQNADRHSQYYKKLDLENIAAAGMSCGGLQTLDICKDERLKTMMICNSGLFKASNAASAVPGMPMPAKETLKDIHTPIIYILGGPTDIAYENGMDDFANINHVPAFAANFNVGHGGTYSQPHGGEFAVVATAWLKWQLKGDKESGEFFTGQPCGLSLREGWTTDKKNLP